MKSTIFVSPCQGQPIDNTGKALTKNPLGRFTRTDYDLLDRVLKVTDPQGKFESWSYDGNGNGNRKSYTDAKGQVTNFTYDNRDRLAFKQDALLRTESYAYDLASNLIFTTDRKGQVTGHVYDALGRRTQVGYGATSTTAPTFTSTITYTYDAANRLTQAADTANGNISRTYDDRFDTVTQEVTAQGTVDYSYYAANRLTQIAQAAGLTAAQPSTAQSVGFTYDTANRPTKVTLPNGITQNYAYNNNSELASISYKKADTTVIGDLSYTYNNAGVRTATGGTLARTALPASIGSTVHNANNQLTTKDAVAHTYDLNGNLINDGSRTYTWNVRNQLATIAGADTASYYYDAFGRRRSATVNGQSTSTLYDGWNPVQLQSGGVAVENRLYGLGLDSVYNRTRGGVTESFLRDALGSTLELRNAAQAQTVQYTYDPYGGTAASVASSNTIKYTGREQDAADLYYYRNRYFKPSTGRFVSEDPIGLAGGSNLYAYVNGNPVNWVDPLGLYQMCHRSMPMPYARHCFMKFDDGSTMGYYPDGTKPEESSSQEGAMCTAPKEPEQDDCIKKAMKQCEAKNYDFTVFNCCHCAEQAMKECGVSIPPSTWPNWPINPGPQPGYSPTPIYSPILGL